MKVDAIGIERETKWINAHDFAFTSNGITIKLNAEYEFYLDDNGYPSTPTGRSRLTEKSN